MEMRSKQQIKVDKMEELLVQELGYEKAFNELSKALTYKQKEDLYSFILKMWDIDSEEGEEL